MQALVKKMKFSLYFRDNQNEGSEQKFKIEKMWAFPKYGKSTFDYDNDIAVLKLDRPAKLSKSVGIACLPSQYEKVPSDAKCYVSGLLKFRIAHQNL